MKIETLKRGCVAFVAIYIICVTAVYFIAGNQFLVRQDPSSPRSEESRAPLGEIVKDFSIMQTFISQTDNISEISIKFSTYNRNNNGILVVQILEVNNSSIVYKIGLDVSLLKDNSYMTLSLSSPIQNTKGKKYALYLLSDSTDKTNAITAYYNNETKSQGKQLYIDEQPVEGELCFTASGTKNILFGQHYFEIMAIVGIFLTLYCINLYVKEKSGKKSWGLGVINAFVKYKFLLSQLVNRDFKTKYKRSLLGVLWSFLNPLLTMMVQYVVFSTMFKSNIDNFPVYLLTGIIFYNFFSEATGMALNSIVGNSSLLTKVYIPKYIFPISRVLSSAINFSLSLIPMLIFVIITRTHITTALLLLPFTFLCLIVFCIGMGMLMSAAMVFFRDTQFLWNVISMLWMYATPIFYPESIIPIKYLAIYKMNPMYYYIKFCRTVILQGISPEPIVYMYCIFFSLISLMSGVIVFKKTQDKFILYI